MKPIFQLLLLLSLISFIQACSSRNNNKEAMNKFEIIKQMEKNPGSSLTSCQLIRKSFTNVGGKITDYLDYYLRCSIEDYLIKLCESNITAEDLKPYLNAGITVEMEIRHGYIDHCNENPAYTQSRTGTYAVIIRIIE